MVTAVASAGQVRPAGTRREAAGPDAVRERTGRGRRVHRRDRRRLRGHAADAAATPRHREQRTQETYAHGFLPAREAGPEPAEARIPAMIGTGNILRSNYQPSLIGRGEARLCTGPIRP